MDRSHPLIVLFIAGCAPSPAPGAGQFEGAQRASVVVSAPTETGEGYKDPGLAVNGVHGGGMTQGSLDVYSISLGGDDELVVGFETPVVDQEGVDLVVYENPFDIAGGGRFMDPTVVEVSADGLDFVVFPHRYEGQGDLSDPDDWLGFAGITPVLLHEEDNLVEPLSDAAGGDGFDLAVLEEAPDEVWFIRLTSASRWLDPETGSPFLLEPVSNGPDIDGVYGTTP